VVVSEMIGTFHLIRPWLYGPAERTLIEPWLTSVRQVLNAYAEVAVEEEAIVIPVQERRARVEPVEILIPTRLLRREEVIPLLMEPMAA
jgi:hypothetical protein